MNTPSGRNESTSFRRRTQGAQGASWATKEPPHEEKSPPASTMRRARQEHGQALRSSREWPWRPLQAARRQIHGPKNSGGKSAFDQGCPRGPSPLLGKTVELKSRGYA